MDYGKVANAVNKESLELDIKRIIAHATAGDEPTLPPRLHAAYLIQLHHLEVNIGALI